MLCALQNKPLIPQVVLVLAHGLTHQLFEQHKQYLPRLAGLQPPAVTLALNSNVRAGKTVNARAGAACTKHHVCLARQQV